MLPKRSETWISKNLSLSTNRNSINSSFVDSSTWPRKNNSLRCHCLTLLLTLTVNTQILRCLGNMEFHSLTDEQKPEKITAKRHTFKATFTYSKTFLSGLVKTLLLENKNITFFYFILRNFSQLAPLCEVLCSIKRSSTRSNCGWYQHYKVGNPVPVLWSNHKLDLVLVI